MELYWIAVGNVLDGARREIEGAGGIVIAPGNKARGGIPLVWLVGLPHKGDLQYANTGEFSTGRISIYWTEHDDIHRSGEGRSINETMLLNPDDWERLHRQEQEASERVSLPDKEFF